MSTAKSPELAETVTHLDLKDREIAALLAWLLPGLGHAYQRRWAKAALFFVCILGLFVYGVYLGSDSQRKWWGRVVYFAGTDRLPYVCQVGVGLPALPALVQAVRTSHNQRVWFDGFMAPPRLSSGGQAEDPNRDQPTLHDLHLHLAHYFEFGTVYTMIAGLLNVLAIYDAWGGPVLPAPDAKKDDEDDQEQADPAAAPVK